MVEKLIPVETGVGKQCQCGRWHSHKDREENLLCDGCGRVLVVVEITTGPHCSICTTETDGAPLCDRCARQVYSNCKLIHLAIAAGARVGSGMIDNLRRDEALLERQAEWEANADGPTSWPHTEGERYPGCDYNLVPRV